MTNSTPTGAEAERNASPPHSHASRESLEGLGVSAEQGLDVAEAKKRLEEAGPNVLAQDPRGGVLRIIWHQLNDPLMYVLLGSGTLPGSREASVRTQGHQALDPRHVRKRRLPHRPRAARTVAYQG